MMKSFILLVFLGVFLSTMINCGSGSSNSDTCTTSPSIGSWTGTTQDDSLQLTSSGEFIYTGINGCKTMGSFSCPGGSDTSGTLKVKINVSTGDYCLPAGDYDCNFQVIENTLGFVCSNDDYKGTNAVYEKK